MINSRPLSPMLASRSNRKYAPLPNQERTLTISTRNENDLSMKHLAIFNDSANRLGSSTVKLLVGLEEEVFQADKILLCRESPFFDSAFNGHFQERCNEIRLPEETPITIHLLLSWIYGRRVGFFHGKRVTTAELSSGDILEYFALFNTADKMCIMSLKKYCWGIILEWCRHHGFCQEHLLSAAYALAITDELKKLLALEVALVFSRSSEKDVPTWLPECLESVPSLAPRVLTAQSELARRVMRATEDYHVTAEKHTHIVNQMIKEIF